jgi:MFS family permease
LISEAFPPEQQAKAIGIWGAITGMAVAVAPVVGGAIVSGLAWRWIFWVNVPIGLAVLAAGLLRLTRTPKVSTRLDLIGVVLGGPAVGALVYAIQEGPTAGWASAQVLASAIAGVILVGARAIEVGARVFEGPFRLVAGSTDAPLTNGGRQAPRRALRLIWH